MKRINQVKESREQIENAFLRLLDSKDYSSITLTEVAAEAFLTRMTLYRHFKSKEEIVISCFKKQLNREIGILKEVDEPILYDLMLFHFRVIKSSDVIKHIRNNNEMQEITRSVYIEYFAKYEEILPKVSDVKKHFIIGGINQITVMWLENDCNTSCEEMAKQAVELSRAVAKVEGI